MGAIATYKLRNDQDLADFFEDKPAADYLMEEYITGEVTTYDGVCNSKGEVLFAASHVTPNSIMDMVNEHIPTYYYVNKQVPPEVEQAGKATLKALGPPAASSTWSFSGSPRPKRDWVTWGTLWPWRSTCAPPAVSPRTCSTSARV